MAYDWKITAKKVSWQLLYVAVAGILSVYANNPYVLALAPALHGLENYIKHKDD